MKRALVMLISVLVIGLAIGYSLWLIDIGARMYREAQERATPRCAFITRDGKVIGVVCALPGGEVAAFERKRTVLNSRKPLTSP